MNERHEKPGLWRRQTGERSGGEVRRASTRVSAAKEEDGRYLVGKQESDKVRLVFRTMTVSALLANSIIRPFNDQVKLF